MTRVSPTSVKSENSSLKFEYDDQLWSLIQNSGGCGQYVSFASDKCLNMFWWVDNRGAVHWFRDNDKSDEAGKTVFVKSDFFPIRAIGRGPSDSNSHLDCNVDKVIVEDLVCSGKSQKFYQRHIRET